MAVGFNPSVSDIEFKKGKGEDSRCTMGASRQIKQSHPTGRHTEDNSSKSVHMSKKNAGFGWNKVLYCPQIRPASLIGKCLSKMPTDFNQSQYLLQICPIVTMSLMFRPTLHDLCRFLKT